MKKVRQNENSIAGMMALGKYPDLSGLTEEEKGKAIRDFVEITSRYFLQLFLMLGLKTHIETMIVNETTGKEYILSFKTVEKFMQDTFTTPDQSINQSSDDYCTCYNEGWTRRDGITTCRNCLKLVNLKVSDDTRDDYYNREKLCERK